MVKAMSENAIHRLEKRARINSEKHIEYYYLWQIKVTDGWEFLDNQLFTTQQEAEEWLEKHYIKLVSKG